MDSNPIATFVDEGALSGRIEATEDVEGHVSRGRGLEGPDNRHVSKATCLSSAAFEAPERSDENSPTSRATALSPATAWTVLRTRGHMPRIRFAVDP